MRRVVLGVSAVAALMAFGGLSACGVGTDCDFGHCAGEPADGVQGDGGPDGPDVVAPPNCDLTKGPKDSPACIDDGVGIFVAPFGDDGATGTKGAPVKSIAKGVELAASRNVPRVYVCEGTYGTAVEVRAAVSIFGELSCDWSVGGAKPKLAPSSGIALRVTKVTGPVLVEGLEIVGAADAAKPGDSAIAAFVSESTNVTLRSLTLTATAGTAGAEGGSASNYSGATATAGGNSNGATAGAGASCTCVDGSTSLGGNGAGGNGAGLTDGSATPPVGDSNGGSSSTTTCDPGTVGANGTGQAGGTAATSAGTLSASGWVATTRPRERTEREARTRRWGWGGKDDPQLGRRRRRMRWLWWCGRRAWLEWRLELRASLVQIHRRRGSEHARHRRRRDRR